MSDKTYEMSASVILVQLPDGEKITAFIGLGDGQGEKRIELDCRAVRDTENKRAWLSEALSAVLDQL